MWEVAVDKPRVQFGWCWSVQLAMMSRWDTDTRGRKDYDTVDLVGNQKVYGTAVVIVVVVVGEEDMIPVYLCAGMRDFRMEDFVVDKEWGR